MKEHRASVSDTPWSLVGRRAVLAHGGLSARVDAEAPGRGLTQLALRGQEIAGHLLGVEGGADASPDDVHVRGADLVAAYRERPERLYAVEVYWSVSGQPGGAVILDATISIQTRQWEAYPSVTVASQLDDAQGVTVGEAIRILRPRGADWSVVEVVPVEDFESIATLDASATAWRFGPQFMERGVIRRLRVRCGVVARQGDEAAARRLQAELQAEAPPLTA